MKIRYRFQLLLVVVFGLFLPALAEDVDQELSTMEQDSQSYQNRKSIRDYHEAEVRLDKAYKAKLSAEKDKVRKQKLIDAQKAWIAYRDAEVAYVHYVPTGGYGGSGYTQFFNITLTRLTEERIKELNIEE